jgi:hypothetical protein
MIFAKKNLGVGRVISIFAGCLANHDYVHIPLLVRRLIWMRNPRGFQVRDRDGGSPGSIAYISKGKTDG